MPLARSKIVDTFLLVEKAVLSDSQQFGFSFLLQVDAIEGMHMDIT